MDLHSLYEVKLCTGERSGIPMAASGFIKAASLRKTEIPGLRTSGCGEFDL